MKPLFRSLDPWHSRCCQKITWYRLWHERPYALFLHWLTLFLVVLVSFISFLSVLTIKPKTAKAVLSSYTLSGITSPSSTHQGFNAESSARPPGGLTISGETEFSSANYSDAASSNDSRVQTNNFTFNSYPAARFRFKINENVLTISKIDVLWEGWGCKGETCGGSFEAELYIWNANSSAWEQVGSHTNSEDQNIAKSYTNGLNNYLDSDNYLYLVALGPKRTTYMFPNWLYTDFVKVDITYSANQAPAATAPSGISQATNGTGILSFQTQISDSNAHTTKLKAEFSDDNGSSYKDPELSSVSASAGSPSLSNGSVYQISNISTSSDNTLTIRFDTKSSNNQGGAISQGSNFKVRLTPNDNIEDGSPATSATFSIDNQAPTGLSNQSPSNGATGQSASPVLIADAVSDLSSVTYQFQLCSDSNFNQNCQNSSYQSSRQWTSSSLSNNTRYYWRYRAKDGLGNESGFGSSTYFTTQASNTNTNDNGNNDATDNNENQTLPAAPSLLDGQGKSESEITWNFIDNSSNETGFKLHDDNHRVLATVGANTSSIIEKGLSANTQYSRHLHALNSQGDSAASSAKQAGTLTKAPRNLIATTGKTEAEGYFIELKWEAPDKGADQYQIYSSANNFGSALVKTNQLTYKDRQLKAKTKYTYRLFGLNASGEEGLNYAEVTITSSEQATTARGETKEKKIEEKNPDSVEQALKNTASVLADTSPALAKFLTTIVTFKSRQEVKNLARKVATPSAAVTAGLGSIGVAAHLPATVSSLYFNLLRLLAVGILPLRRRSKPWGRVVDRASNQPISGAVVRIFETQLNKLKETQTTDDLGRFGFLVKPGQYFVTVDKPGYTFQQELGKTRSALAGIYQGGIIDIKEAGTLNMTVFLDPQSKSLPKLLAWRLRLINYLLTLLEHLNGLFLFVGGALAVFAYFIIASGYNLFILLLYLVLLGLRLSLGRNVQRPYGKVYDVRSKKGLNLAIVRLYDTRQGVLRATKVTDNLGRFTFLISPGSYYLVVAASDFKTQTTKPFVLKQRESAVNLAIGLLPAAGGI
ncbi:carboxypeptidase regulatory-like domain-containing protein [Candidatus Berkelbacteria bacterium]|nr:carboxypeptidase regulatory-like domain-containing protein [Candidatus Berkelbacteria bacterium]